MNKNKLLSFALAGVLLAGGVSTNVIAKSDDYWNESSESQINKAVNKVKIYKDAIIVYTNNSNSVVSLYDDDDGKIASTDTDVSGNAVLNVDGYHDHMYKDHYLKVDGTKIYLDNDVVEIVNGYYYDENADDDYDPTDADENDSRVFPKYEFLNNYTSIRGELKDYENKTVKVYIDDKYTAFADIDKNGNFTVNLPRTIRNKHMIKFYVRNNLPKTRELKPWDVMVAEFSVSGRYNADKKIKAYYGDKELGETVTGSNGEFTIETNYRLPRNASVKFFEGGAIVPSSAISTNSYIKGFADGTFRPNNKITRAEAAVMIARLMSGGDNFANASTPYSDANNKWYSGAVNYVSQKGIIKGYGNHKFMPERNITRAEFVKMISNYLNEEVDQKSGFRDVENHWAKDDIDILTDKGYIKGYPSGHFKPDNYITRAEAVKILNETFGIKDSGYENMSFSDINKADWYFKEVAKALNN